MKPNNNLETEDAFLAATVASMGELNDNELGLTLGFTSFNPTRCRLRTSFTPEQFSTQGKGASDKHS